MDSSASPSAASPPPPPSLSLSVCRTSYQRPAFPAHSVVPHSSESILAIRRRRLGGDADAAGDGGDGGIVRAGGGRPAAGKPLRPSGYPSRRPADAPVAQLFYGEQLINAVNQETNDE